MNVVPHAPAPVAVAPVPAPASPASGAAASPRPAIRAQGRRRAATRLLAADGLCLLVLAACAVLLHWQGLAGGPIFYERDTQLFYAPLAGWVSGQLRAGFFPLWLPDIFTGYPIFADGELGLAYLPQVLALWLLPVDQAIVWLRTLHAFLAGAFMYLFLRTLRLGPLAALGGALVFAFGSFLTAQMPHENVIRSAVWLPLVLTLVERALRARPLRRSLAWSAAAALAFAQAALGVHVQPVLMEALAVGAWVVFRALLGSPGVRAAGPRTLAAALFGPVLGGLALAAVQWIPLAEWALVSVRRGGVSYDFASAFAVAPANLLPTLLFPYFLRQPDAATWWSLWQPWETELYVGVPTLALLLVGVVASRRREMLFFALLGIVAVWLAMAQYATGLPNLHQVLWAVPGFSFLRAPGRFTYLAVFAFAGLAALGLQALLDRTARLNRLIVAVVGGGPAGVLLLGLLVLLPSARVWLLDNRAAGLRLIEDTYLALRSQGPPMSAAYVLDGLLGSLDVLGNPKTALGLSLLGLTTLLFWGWYRLGRARAWAGQAAFVSLLALDLLAFGADFHPRAAFADLAPPALAGVPPGARVLVDDDGRSLPELEPNAPLWTGLRSVAGYSSLPSQRYVDLYAQSALQPSLRDVWAAEYLVEPAQPVDGLQVGGVMFRFNFPLAAGYGSPSPATAFALPPGEAAGAVAIRVVATLSYGFEVPQGETVGEVTVSDSAPGGRALTLPLRAGVEVAERAIDRPSLQGLVRHQKPPGPTAVDFDEWAPSGEGYQAHLYLAEIALPEGQRLAEVRLVQVRPTRPTALLQVYGLGLVRADGSVRTVTAGDGVGLREVPQPPGSRYRVYADDQALPRAYVQDAAYAVARAERPDSTPVQVMSGGAGSVPGGFDPRSSFLVEGASADPDARARVASARQPGRAARVQELGPNALRIEGARADAPSYLVVNDFYHRGWRAWVDGRETPIQIVNAVFRGVPLEPGTHTVELRFEPLTLLLGAAVSTVALVGALLLMVRGALARD